MSMIAPARQKRASSEVLCTALVPSTEYASSIAGVITLNAIVTPPAEVQDDKIVPRR